MNWSVEQRRLLDAMGYELFVCAPAADEHPRTTPMPVTTVDRLFQALARAAGGADLSALDVDLDALRRDPARKRVLWPRLRALLRRD